MTSCSSLALLQNIGRANPVLGTLADAAEPAGADRGVPGLDAGAERAAARHVGARAAASRGGARLMQKQAPSLGRVMVMAASRCRASACCCSCGWPSAARSRCSRRATASRSASRRPASSRRRPTCGSPACRSARSRRSTPTRQTGRRTRRSSSTQYAPLPSDTRAILRQKTLLGETYVELTPGTSAGARRCPRAARCRAGRSRRRSSSTRSSARSTRRRARRSSWMDQLAVAVDGRGAGHQRRARQPRRRSPRTRTRC